MRMTHWGIKLDIPIPDLDLRLLEIDSELFALDYHLNLIENQIRNKEAFERMLLQKRIKKLGLTHNDLDWQIEHYEVDRITDFLLPRFFRSPFLISLYAVYESAITEIAALIQKKKGIEISINDLRGDFLDRAKKYFKDVIDFPFCSDKKAWQRITMFVEIRHAIAHANGRIEMLKLKTRNNLKTWEKQKVGISSMDGFVVIEEGFVRDTLSLVSDSLNDLVERYKEWDDNQNSS